VPEGAVLPRLALLPGISEPGLSLSWEPVQPKEIHMPVILWLLGVPVVVVLLLMFLHII